jgi:hypothetical protein
MTKTISVRLDKSRQEKLTFLYKLYQVKSEKDSDRFRELLDKIYSEILEPSNTSTLSKTPHKELELLEGWDCANRAVVYRFDKHSKKKEPRVFCIRIDTRKILGTNVIDISVCKKCHDTVGSIKLLTPPEPKKPTPKPQSKTSKRQCIDCGSDISRLDEWKKRCLDCWRIEQVRKQKGNYDGKPLPGSPMAIRKQLAARTRSADEKLKQSKEE